MNFTFKPNELELMVRRVRTFAYTFLQDPEAFDFIQTDDFPFTAASGPLQTSIDNSFGVTFQVSLDQALHILLARASYSMTLVQHKPSSYYKKWRALAQAYREELPLQLSEAYFSKPSQTEVPNE